MAKYIYQYKDWYHFKWNDNDVQVILGKVRLLQGKILGQMQGLGFSIQEETMLSALTLDVLKSSEIEIKRKTAQSVDFTNNVNTLNNDMSIKEKNSVFRSKL